MDFIVWEKFELRNFNSFLPGRLAKNPALTLAFQKVISKVVGHMRFKRRDIWPEIDIFRMMKNWT